MSTRPHNTSYSTPLWQKHREYPNFVSLFLKLAETRTSCISAGGAAVRYPWTAVRVIIFRATDGLSISKAVFKSKISVGDVFCLCVLTIDASLGPHMQPLPFRRLLFFTYCVHQDGRVPLGEHSISRRPFESSASSFLGNTRRRIFHASEARRSPLKRMSNQYVVSNS